MSRRTIVSIAGVCGAVAFVWALVARAPLAGPLVIRPMGAPPAPPDFLPPDIEGLRDLLQREPGHHRAWMQLAVLLRDQDRAEEAKEAWEGALAAARESEGIDPRPARPLFAATWAAYQLGQMEKARESARRADEVYSTPEMLDRVSRSDGMMYRLGWIRAILGREEDARSAWATAARLIEARLPQGIGADQAYALAGYRSLAGDTLGALEALKLAVAKGFHNAAHALHDEALEPIRGEAEFQRIVGMMQGPPGAKRDEGQPGR